MANKKQSSDDDSFFSDFSGGFNKGNATDRLMAAGKRAQDWIKGETSKFMGQYKKKDKK